jgi:flagellar biosynthesis protein FlhB
MKRFEPTQSRLERARREGDHPLSRDAVAVGTSCGALLGLIAMLPLARSVTGESMRAVLAAGATSRLATALALTVAVVAACGAAGCVLTTFGQTRGIALRPLAIRLNLTPPLGLDAASGVARSTLAVLAALASIALAIRPDPAAIVRVVQSALAVGIVAASVDVLFVRKSWLRRLRMTHEELRRDMREHDGDPQARMRRRRLHRTLVRGSLRHIRRATFVVVNPTHVAIALRYVADETPVPMILVRAADDWALRVKKLASEAGIPAIEDPPLARRLYALDALGPIPPELYLAVAQIIATLNRER